MSGRWRRGVAHLWQFLGVANLLKNSAMMLKIVVDAFLEKEGAAGTDLHALAASGGGSADE